MFTALPRPAPRNWKGHCRPRHELFDSTLAARRRRDAPHGGRSAAVSRSSRAAGRSGRSRPMAGAGAAGRQARAAPRFSEVARARASGSAAPRCATSASRCSPPRARRPIGCRSSGNGRGGTRRSARRCGSTRASRAAMGSAEYREAVLTTPACGAGTCHFGSQTRGRAQHRRHSVLQRERRSHALDRRRVRANVARMVRVRAARRRSGSGVSRDHRACRAEARHAVAVAGVHHADLRDDDAGHAPRHRRAFDAPLFQLYGATEAGVLFMECEHGRLHPNERHSHVDLVPLPGGARLARVLVTTLGPRLDAAAALRHRRRRARGRVARLRVRLDERRAVARARRRAAERLHGRRGETITPLMLDDAIHAALESRVDARAVAARRRHAARRRSARAATAPPGRRGRRRAAATRDSRRARRGHRTRGFRQVSARQALMQPDGFPLLERGYDGAPFIYLDSASTTPKPREVIAAVARYYETLGANVHRGLYPLAEAATEEYERARHRVAALIGAQPSEIVFTRNATDSFNLVARALASRRPTTRSCSRRPSITRTICRGGSRRGPCSSISTTRPCRSGRSSRSGSASARAS